MARITRVKKAQKAQGTCGRSGCDVEIKIGDSYYWWANRIGRYSQRHVRCASHYPRQSEMTTSDKLSRLYGAQESIDDALAAWSPYEDPSSEPITQALRDAAEEAEGVGQEYGESADNMEEHFSGSAQIDEIREKADSCESWAGRLNEVADQVEDMEPEEIPEDADDDKRMEILDAFKDEVEAEASSASGELDL